jgi:hypothetical protein
LSDKFKHVEGAPLMALSVIDATGVPVRSFPQKIPEEYPSLFPPKALLHALTVTASDAVEEVHSLLAVTETVPLLEPNNIEI